MAMATTPHQSKMLCSTSVTGPILRHCIVPYHVPFSNVVSFPVGGNHRSRIGMRVEAKLGKATKTAPSTDSEKKWIHHGLVTESLPNGMFRVGLVNLVANKFVRVNEEVMLGYVSGKIRTNHIRIVPGDIVRVEISPYDSQKGRIVYRLSRRDMDKLTGLGPKDDSS